MRWRDPKGISVGRTVNARRLLKKECGSGCREYKRSEATSVRDGVLKNVFRIQHLAIAHMQDAIPNRGCFRIVRNHHHRLLQLLVGAAQDSEHGI